MSRLKAILKPAVRQSVTAQKTAKKWSDIAGWRLFKGRPDLNATVAAAHVTNASDQSEILTRGVGASIHVRIAFHYAPQRLKYLAETISAVTSWPFEEIDIWLDTNTAKLEHELKDLPGNCRVAVWDNLEHPFKLTWAHRKAMRDNLDNFSAFAYLEDDIIIPRQSMERWLEETPRLAKHGLLQGFVRVEQTSSGKLVLADYCERVSKSLVYKIEGRPYLSTPYPYQACWIYDASHMKELNGRPGYLSGTIEDASLFQRDGTPAIRERVALGLQFVSVPDGYESRAAIPLTDDLKVASDALIFHSPCNYATRKPPHPAGLGQIPVDEIFYD